jgi:hypothetical protein
MSLGAISAAGSPCETLPRKSFRAAAPRNVTKVALCISPRIFNSPDR